MEIARVCQSSLNAPLLRQISRFPLCSRTSDKVAFNTSFTPSFFVKKAATVCHVGYKYTFVTATKQDLISVSATAALQKQTSF